MILVILSSIFIDYWCKILKICGCGEMADALASGASVRKYVEVQVLSSAPSFVARPDKSG